MAVRNEGRYIGRSLGSIFRQDYPAKLTEVLVADGMSTDGTRALISQAQLDYPAVEVKVLENSGLTVPKGLNLALDRCRGDVIVRVDGRTELAPDYIRQCIAVLNTTGADNVGGRRQPLGSGLVGAAVAVAITTPFGVGGHRLEQSPRQEWVDTVYLGAWRRQTFERVGFFDEEMTRNQDDEFNYRLRKEGGRILASPTIRSTYINRSSVVELWRQYFQFGYWKVRVLQKHPRQMQLRQFAPPMFVGLLVLATMTALVLGSGRLLLITIAGGYLLANLAASLLTAVRSRMRYLFLFPVVFATLHLSYGTGFLAGLVRFAGRWGEAFDIGAGKADKRRPENRL
jgi:succinoglycan biosynthesis protein ExoA